LFADLCLPEGYEGITLLAANNMHTSFRDGESMEVLSDVKSIG
jgi:hypothetical protein